MVRKKIEIKKIEKASSRMVTFSKRRKGLFKKVTELHSRTAAKAAVVVFSPAGNPFTHGEPSVDSVINDYFRLVGHQENEGNNVVASGTCSSVPDNGKDLERREDGVAANPAKEWLEGVKVEECENLEEVTAVLKKLEEIERGCEYKKLLLFLFDD